MEGPAEHIVWAFWKLALPFFQEGALVMMWSGRENFCLVLLVSSLGAVLMGERGTEGGEGGKGAVFALCPQCGLGEGRFLWALFLLSCTKI